MLIADHSNVLNDPAQKRAGYKKFIVDERLRYFKPHATRIEKSFADEIASSLDGDSKHISPKFFYDLKGSDLFEKICALLEYYPTRTEISLLKELQTEISDFLEGDLRLVELGSGSSVKTRLLLDVLSEQRHVEYFPIDISEILAESSEQLLRDYANLTITGIIDTFEGGLEFLKTYDKKKSLIAFLGSSFGNFSPADGQKFLDTVFSTMRSGDLFLIGLDLVKDHKILESAYNDADGITAEFNLNVLSRINDELDADFDLKNFAHHSIYNKKDQRVEMYLRSLSEQSIVISKSNLILRLKKGELIHTEYSYKYRPSEIRDILTGAGFSIKRIWLDKNEYFSLTLVSKD